MTATRAEIDAAIARAKRPPRPVREEGETVKDYRARLDWWRGGVCKRCGQHRPASNTIHTCVERGTR